MPLIRHLVRSRICLVGWCFVNAHSRRNVSTVYLALTWLWLPILRREVWPWRVTCYGRTHHPLVGAHGSCYAVRFRQGTATAVDFGDGRDGTIGFVEGIPALLAGIGRKEGRRCGAVTLLWSLRRRWREGGLLGYDGSSVVFPNRIRCEITAVGGRMRLVMLWDGLICWIAG